jgi:hypothetical protein
VVALAERFSKVLPKLGLEGLPSEAACLFEVGNMVGTGANACRAQVKQAKPTALLNH